MTNIHDKEAIISKIKRCMDLYVATGNHSQTLIGLSEDD